MFDSGFMVTSRELLHEAVKARDVEQVCVLLSQGADPNALDARGKPPLAYVLSSGVGFVLEDWTRAMVWALRRAGADPKVAGVGRALIDDAHAMVTAAGEARDARELAGLLGV
jgi:hypothetical protein